MESVLLNISAGSGPEECAYAAALTLQVLQEEIKERKSISFRIIEAESSTINRNIRPALISLEGIAIGNLNAETLFVFMTGRP